MPVPNAQSTRRHSRAALRLVKTRDLSREEWLSVRRQGIGSSDAAAAIGLNPHQSMLELWMIKTGRAHLLPQSRPGDRNSATYWGSLLEPIVAAHYTHETGNKIRKINAVLQHPDPDKAWMLANIDREILGASDVQILECKTAGEFGARIWREGVPEYVQCQVQHQLAVTGKEAADVCVLICGQEIQIHRIDRDDKLIEGLIRLEREFWQYVESNIQPPPDGSESADRALRSLYAHDYGNVADFRDNRAMSAVFADLQAIREEIATRDKIEQPTEANHPADDGELESSAFRDGISLLETQQRQHPARCQPTENRSSISGQKLSFSQSR